VSRKQQKKNNINKTHTTMPKQAKERKSRSADVVTREYTVNLNKRLHKVTFKNKAPKAITELKKFAKQVMGTEDVRIDVNLNKFLWSQGIRNVPSRVRVRLHRKRNEDEEAQDQLYTLVTHVNVDSYRGLQSTNVEMDDE